MLGDLFYRLGTAVGSLDAQISGKAGAGAGRPPREVAVLDPEGDAVHDADAGDAAGTSLTVLTGAWLLSRLFRPKPVRWSRVIVAGVAAAAIADLVGRATDDTAEPGRLPFADDTEELAARLGAGVAVAAGYAAILYPRIPGPPIFRGLVFGALEVLAAPRGGLAALASAAPGVRFPLQALALPVDEDAGPLSHLAFGLGLGLFYRYHDAEADD